MGTRLTLYTIERKDWWTFSQNLRQLYVDEYPLLKADVLQPSERSVSAEDIKQLMHWLENNTVELQVFEDHNLYRFRVLEHGYFFMNNHVKIAPLMPCIFYDDHSDMTPEMEQMRYWVDWVDDRIKARHYWLYPVVTMDDFTVFLDKLKGK